MLAVDHPLSSYFNERRADALTLDVLSSIDFRPMMMQRRTSLYSDTNEPFLLLQHMVNCIYALRNMMNIHSSRSALPLAESECDIISKTMLSGFSSELIKIVIFTITTHWKETDAPILNDYFLMSEYILQLFPDLFTNLNSDINLLHLSCKYSSPVTAVRATEMILQLDPNMASQLDGSKNYPLHSALLNKKATLKNIELLVRNNRQALSAQDMNGFLPLHIALIAVQDEVVDEDIVIFLIEQYPQAVSIPDRKGRLPIQICASSPNPSVQLIKALLAVNPSSINISCKNSWLPVHRLINRPKIPLGSLFALLHGHDGIHTDHNSLVEHLSFSNVNEHRNEVAPKIASAVNNNGQYPIHIYCDIPFPNLEVIFGLARSDPSSLLHRDNNSYLPLHILVDQRNPNRDAVMLLIYCDISKESLSLGIPYVIHGLVNNSHKNLLFPLHFLVGLVDEVDVSLCIVFAAFYPKAIKYSNVDPECSLDLVNGGTIDKALIWSPYDKAVKKNLSSLINAFDNILDKEQYRLSVIAEFNKVMEKKVESLIISIISTLAVTRGRKTAFAAVAAATTTTANATTTTANANANTTTANANANTNAAKEVGTPFVAKLTETALNKHVVEMAKKESLQKLSHNLSPMLEVSPVLKEGPQKTPTKSITSTPSKKTNYFDINSIYSDEADSEIGFVQKRIMSKIYNDNVPSDDIAFDNRDEFIRRSKNGIAMDSVSQISAINEDLNSTLHNNLGAFEDVLDHDLDDDLYVGKTSSATATAELSNDSNFVSYVVDLKSNNTKRVKDFNNNFSSPVKKDTLSLRANTNIIGGNNNNNNIKRAVVVDNQLFASPLIKINGRPTDFVAYSSSPDKTATLSPISKPVSVQSTRKIHSANSSKDNDILDQVNNSTSNLTPRRRLQNKVGAHKTSEAQLSFARSVDETV